MNNLYLNSSLSLL
jgi:hypothetical protein